MNYRTKPSIFPYYKLDTGQLKWWGPNRHIYLTINQTDITDGELRYSTISLKMQQRLNPSEKGYRRL